MSSTGKRYAVGVCAIDFTRILLLHGKFDAPQKGLFFFFSENILALLILLILFALLISKVSSRFSNHTLHID